MIMSLKTPAICYGEILWDVLPDGPQPGGAPLNVAYHLNKMGVHTGIISRVGADDKGRQLEALLLDWGVGSSFLQKDTRYPTSEVIAKMNNGNEVSYDILAPVAWDFIGDACEIKNALMADTYFVYGSLSARNEVTRTTLLDLLESDVIKVFDINLRPPFINREVLEQLLEKANIVKFNQSELETAQMQFGGYYNSEASQVAFIREKFGIDEVIVTKGEFGASYYKGSEAYHAPGSEIKVKDTIGSGDAFLAAFIANHFRKEEPQNILKNAIAMGGFVATKKGGCPEYQLEEYLDFKTN
jgi:fructokinase